MMRAPIAYGRRTTPPPPNVVPRLAPEVYAGRISEQREAHTVPAGTVYPTGRGGTVTVEHDGTGTVRDVEGRYRTTLPAHTVREVVTAATKMTP